MSRWWGQSYRKAILLFMNVVRVMAMVEGEQEHKGRRKQ